jgi:hypothetical protein
MTAGAVARPTLVIVWLLTAVICLLKPEHWKLESIAIAVHGNDLFAT